MMNKLAQKPVRIGLLATDAMRIMGLQAILSEGRELRSFSVATPSAMDLDHLRLLVIDAEATDRLFDLVRSLRKERPELGIMVLAADGSFDQIERVIGAGARGYLTYSATENELRMAIDVVLDGSVWAPRKVLARLIEQSLVGEAKQRAAGIHLTKRESEVLGLLVLGHPNRQIANALGVDETTVKAHMGRLMRKAGVDNRTALSMRAVEGHWA
jgi:DNA-binding NarL/FixJ family response regulator